MSSKGSVRKAIEAITSGDARALRKHIKEALLSKVKVAVNRKEKSLAKSLLDTVTKKQSE